MTSFYIDSIQQQLTESFFLDAPATFTPPSIWYVALLTTMPDTVPSGGVEAAYTGYARFGVAASPLEFTSSGSPVVTTNVNDWDFGVAGSGPTDVVGFGFCVDNTSPVNDVLWAAASLVGAPVTIAAGDDVKFLAGAVLLGGC